MLVIKVNKFICIFLYFGLSVSHINTKLLVIYNRIYIIALYNIIILLWRFRTILTVDFTKLWPRQLRGWLGIWEL